MESTSTQPIDPSETLALLMADPRTVNAVRDIQCRAVAMLEHKIDALVVALGVAEPARPTAQERVTMDARQLANTSRQAGEVVNSRRKFARDILIATLINRANDDWDMTDATTWRADPDDLLIALMKMPRIS